MPVNDAPGDAPDVAVAVSSLLSVSSRFTAGTGSKFIAAIIAVTESKFTTGTGSITSFASMFLIFASMFSVLGS